MIKGVLLGVVAAAAVIAGEMGADQVLAMRQARSTAAATRTTEARKTHEINVPRIKDGAIKGYAVMLLSYNDDTIDFDHLDRFDFAKMSKALVGTINARVKSEVIVDVGVQEFTYEPVSEIRGRSGP
jgi:hypothetical protein